MATNETERIEHDANEPTVAVEATAPISSPNPERLLSPAQAPAPEPPADLGPASDAADKLRAEFAEIAAIAAQAARLGVTVDAADAVRKGVSADTLRRSVLDTLAVRAEATSIIAAAPSTPMGGGDSPIVRRAKERAAGNRA